MNVSTDQICERLGRASLMEALQVKAPAISNAIKDQKFPASWYRIVRAMCVEAGQPCPESCFSFKKPVEAVGSSKGQFDVS